MSLRRVCSSLGEVVIATKVESGPHIYCRATMVEILSELMNYQKKSTNDDHLNDDWQLFVEGKS